MGLLGVGVIGVLMGATVIFASVIAVIIWLVSRLVTRLVKPGRRATAARPIAREAASAARAEDFSVTETPRPDKAPEAHVTPGNHSRVSIHSRFPDFLSVEESRPTA